MSVGTWWDRRWWAVLAVRLGTVATVGFVAVCALWRVQGGEWERVESPSMGTRAPVGSLLWVRPVAFDSLQVGDFVTVRPPGSMTTYSHLVLERHRDDMITTKGVLPGPDPWRLGAADVVGRVEATWWGVGWLVAAAPILLVGGLVVAGVRHRSRPGWKLPVTLVLGSLVVSVAITVHQPFVNAAQLGFTPTADGGAAATYVGTGLLPIRLAAPDGASVVLHAGEVGTVHVDADSSTMPATPASMSEVSVELGPALPPWWWVPLVVACFLPALGASLRELRSRRGSRGRASAAGCHRRPRAACP